MKLQKDVSLAQLTTLKVGGSADFLVAAESAAEVTEALAFARERDLPVQILGGGSNILPSDVGWRGLVLQLKLNAITFDGEHVRAEAGTSLPLLVARAAAAGLAGLAEFAGLPGTVGGAVAGNAGCYGREIGDCIEHAEIMWLDGRTETVPARWLECGYRHTHLKDADAILLAVTLKLAKDHATALQKSGLEIAKLRASKQPRGATAGSFFRNPSAADLRASESLVLKKLAESQKIAVDNFKTWQLIDGCGLRGTAVGGAQVSVEHANYLLNADGATAADFVQLARQIQDAVATKYAIKLQPEVQIWSATGLLQL